MGQGDNPACFALTMLSADAFEACGLHLFTGLGIVDLCTPIKYQYQFLHVLFYQQNTNTNSYLVKVQIKYQFRTFAEQFSAVPIILQY